MAPPQSSKRRANGPSALSIPGLAAGLLSAIAAGFFFSRAMRKKRTLAAAVEAEASSESDASQAPILSSFESSPVIQEEQEEQDELQMASFIINGVKPWPPFAINNASAHGEEDILSISATGTISEEIEEEMLSKEKIIGGSAPLRVDTKLIAPPACRQWDHKFGREVSSMMEEASLDSETDIAESHVSSHANQANSISENVSHDQEFKPDSAFQISRIVLDLTATGGLELGPTQISKAALASVLSNDALDVSMSAQKSLIEVIDVDNPVLGSIQFHLESLEENTNCTKKTSQDYAPSAKVNETCLQGLQSRSMAESPENSDSEEDHEQLSNVSSTYDGRSESSTQEVISAAVFPLNSCLIDEVENWLEIKLVGCDSGNSIREDTLTDDAICDVLNKPHYDFGGAQAKMKEEILQDYGAENCSVDATMEVPDLEGFSDHEDGDVPDLVESSGDEEDNVDAKGSKNADMEEKGKREYLSEDLNNKESFCRTSCNGGQNGLSLSNADITEASAHPPGIDMFCCKRELDESKIKNNVIKAFEMMKISDSQVLHASKTHEAKWDEIEQLDIGGRMFHVHSKGETFISRLQNVPFFMLEMVIISLLIGLVAIVLFYFGSSLKQD